MALSSATQHVMLPVGVRQKVENGSILMGTLKSEVKKIIIIKKNDTYTGHGRTISNKLLDLS